MNAAHKVRCLYCGEAMPNPTAPPVASVRRELPQDFDDLVTNALRTGKLRPLSEAIAPASGPGPAGPETGAGESVEEIDLGQVPEVVPAAPAEALPALLEQVDRLRNSGQAEEALALLEGARTLLEDLGAEIGEEAEEARRIPVTLPAYRFRWVLVLSPWTDAMDVGLLSQATRLDMMTLRMLSHHAYAQVAVRSDDRSDLLGRAEAARELGVQASVWERGDLEAIETPPVLLGRTESGWQVCRVPLWQDNVPFDPSAPPPGEALAMLDVSLAVPGEVVVGRYRRTQESGRLGRKREASTRSVGESRVGVLDLHGEGAFLRVVENITDFSGLPGVVTQSTRRSFQGLLEHLSELFPGVTMSGRRVCQSADGKPSVRAGLGLVRSGWPLFEEHTRLLRLHHLGLP